MANDREANREPGRRPAISFVLCARNDTYMGNPVRRLETALNYLGAKLRKLGKENEAEVIVADWGSNVPLRSVLNLGETAAQVTKFLEIPPGLAREQQRDSPFAEVIALNAAVRRTRGRFVGRIDQDTLVGKCFLRAFFAWDDGSDQPRVSLETSFLFSRRREIPFQFAVCEPSVEQVDVLIRWCGRLLMVESGRDFFYSPVGIMLLHRNLWEECGGYDERLIYWGAMEIDLAYRLRSKHPLVDLGKLVGHDFYHLEHYDPGLPRTTPRRMNPEKAENLEFFPNGRDWGLAGHDLPLAEYTDAPRAFPAAKTDQRYLARKESALFLPGAVVTAYVLVPCRFLATIASACARTIAKLARAVGKPRKYPEYCRRLVRSVTSLIAKGG